MNRWMDEWTDDRCKGGRERERKIKCLFWPTFLEASSPGLFPGSTFHQEHMEEYNSSPRGQEPNYRAARRTLGPNPPWPKDLPTLGSFLRPCIPTQYHPGESRPWAHRQALNCLSGLLYSILSRLQKWVITSDQCWCILKSYSVFISPRFAELRTSCVISRSYVHFPNFFFLPTMYSQKSGSTAL